MEQHRTLLIIVSITLFAAVVVGVGLALLYPRDAEGAGDTVATAEGETFDPIEYIRSPEEDEPELEVSEEEGEDQDDVIVVYGEKDDQGAEGPADGKDATAPTVKESEEAPAPEPSEKPRDEAPAEAAPAPRKPAESLGPSGTEKETPRQAAPAPAERAPAEAEPEYRRVTEYWIQVISSPSRDRVEQAKQRLETHELGGRITSRTIEDTTYFRLRVGPYTNKNEAQKFLGWIDDIDGFGESYISEEYPLKRVR